MSWVCRLYRSSLGAKYVMATTGLLLFGFLIAHLLGNLQVFAGPDAVNSYAEKLRSLEPDLMGAGQFAALAEIETEHENTRAGWDWAIQAGLVENSERAMQSLCLFYEMRGR